jgi:hypothetical protein
VGWEVWSQPEQVDTVFRLGWNRSVLCPIDRTQTASSAGACTRSGPARRLQSGRRMGHGINILAQIYPAWWVCPNWLYWWWQGCSSATVEGARAEVMRCVTGCNLCAQLQIRTGTMAQLWRQAGLEHPRMFDRTRSSQPNHRSVHFKETDGFL